jgi:uncharacterized delta-60 repeat protein
VSWATGTAGSLDGDFGGGDGIAVANGAGAAVLREIAVDSTGRTVGVGFSTGATYRWFVARFASDGALDTTFAGGAGHKTLFGTLASDRAMGVAIDASGRILVAGSVTWQSGGSAKKPKLEADFGITRLLSDGTADPGFGSGGTVLTGFQGAGTGDHALAVLAQGDGKIVAGGHSAGSSGQLVALARYTASGALDTTFGAGTGKVVLNLGSGQQSLTSLRRDDLGRYVFVTPGPSAPAMPSFLVRLLSDGSVDGSFGVRNMTTMLAAFGTSFQAQDMALAVDGTILVSGRILTAGTSSSSESIVARFTASGALDTTFGTGGVTMLGLSGPDEARSLSLQQDGRIVLASLWNNPALSNKPVAVSARLLVDGTLDSDYGTGGIGQLADGGPTVSGVWSVALDSSGRLVGGGNTGSGSASRPMLVRWLP